MRARITFHMSGLDIMSVVNPTTWEITIVLTEEDSMAWLSLEEDEKMDYLNRIVSESNQDQVFIDPMVWGFSEEEVFI